MAEAVAREGATQCGLVVRRPTRTESGVELAGAKAVIEGSGGEALTRCLLICLLEFA